jgi:hypothetical protein
VLAVLAQAGGLKKLAQPFNIEKMRSSGFRRITYRTRTELGIAVWHFTEEGTWSDSTHRQGYWTGSDHPAHEPRVTWAYNLPRRGDSVDNANNLGNMMLFEADDHGRARWPMPAYYAARMMMQDWSDPADQPHRLFAAHSEIVDAKGRPMVTAYPLLGPDRHWSVMLVNRDQQHTYRVHMVFRPGTTRDQTLDAGKPVNVVQYSGADYVWLVDGEAGHPIKDKPPERFSINGDGAVLLPAMSLTVVRGNGPNP